MSKGAVTKWNSLLQPRIVPTHRIWSLLSTLWRMSHWAHMRS